MYLGVYVVLGSCYLLLIGYIEREEEAIQVGLGGLKR